MADPFSIYALVDTTARICVSLYNFFNDVADAPEEIKDLLRQLGEFKTLLPLVKKYAEGINNARSSEGNRLAQDALFPMLRACEADFNAIHAAVKDHSPEDLPTLRRLGKAVSWVLEKDQIEALCERLGTAKINLILALHISGGCATYLFQV